MEELDALTDPDVDDQREEDSKTKTSPSPDLPPPSEAPSPRGPEKKVRFSEELVQGSHPRQTAGSQDSSSSESKSLSSSKASSLTKQPGPQQQPVASAEQDGDGPQDQGGGPSAPPAARQQASDTECTGEESSPPTSPTPPSPDKASASLQESPVQPVELNKCSISNTNTGMKPPLWLIYYLNRHKPI